MYKSKKLKKKHNIQKIYSRKKRKCQDYTTISLYKWKKFLTNINNNKIHFEIPSNTPFPASEITDIYIPLAQLIHYNIMCEIKKHKMIGNDYTYILGTNGSVSSGKSTVAELLFKLFNSLPNYHNKVKLISTDSFIYNNKILERKSLMKEKGFPTSYNWDLLIQTILNVKNNKSCIIPKYNQMIGDIDKNHDIVPNNLSLLIVDGINLLNIKEVTLKESSFKVLLSDYLDFSIYIDSSEKNLITFYLDRLKKKQKYVEKYKIMSNSKLISFGKKIWKNINHINLKKYILPYKCRSDVIVTKNINHKVTNINYKI